MDRDGTFSATVLNHLRENRHSSRRGKHLGRFAFRKNFADIRQLNFVMSVRRHQLLFMEDSAFANLGQKY